MKNFPKKQRGFLLVVAIFLIVVFALLSATVAHIFMSVNISSANAISASQAITLSETGLNLGRYAAIGTVPANFSQRTECSAISLLNQSIAGVSGLYSVTGTRYPTSGLTTLSGNITNGSTTIPVASTNGYADMGLIMVGGEWMRYQHKSSTAFLEVTRGISGAASSHASGSVVAQNQCGLTSTALVPNATTVRGRSIQTLDNLQLNSAWAVGNNRFLIGFWNGAQWQDQSSSGSNNRRLYGLYMNSLTSGWAVGVSRTFLRWNGVNWQAGNIKTSNPNAVPNQNYRSVMCLHTDDCWAVGDRRSFVHWDGTIWSAAKVKTTDDKKDDKKDDKNDKKDDDDDEGSIVPNTTYWSVACMKNDSCWAVGNRSDGDYNIAHWDGDEWRRFPTPNTPNRHLYGISCPSANLCLAVGQSRTFLQYSGGTWSNASISGNVANTTYRAISCVSGNDCWAVGNSTRLAHWNGAQWSGYTTSGIPSVTLRGVHCASTDNCWAVGNASGGDMTLHWNGSTWVRVGPSPTLSNIRLNAVFGIAAPKQLPFWEQKTH